MMARPSVGALALLLSLTLGAAVTTGVTGVTAARGDPLGNVRAVKLSMPALGEAAEPCGLDRAALEAAFFKPLAQRGIEAVASGTGYRLFLRAVTIGYLEETCVSYIEAQLLLTTRYQDAANQQERSGHVLLWSDGQLLASDAREHATTLEHGMLKLGSALAARWDLAN
jgi:hypothetical protein